jgi:hypothetical protein
MEPGEALSTASQLAMALAGFAGVVVAFRSGALHQWAPIDKLRLRLLLGNSVVPLLACLVAMLLLSVKPPPPWIWRACSGLSVAFAVPFAISTMKGMRAIRSGELGMAGTWRFLFYGMGILAIGATLLQVYNVVVLNAFWAFFATIVVQLVAGILQFVRLILLPLRQTSDRVQYGSDAGDPPLA